MTDRDIREPSDSEAEPTDVDVESWPEALTDVWWAWLAAAGTAVAAVYFHLTEGIWQTAAEIFYAEIFVIVTVAAVGYGLYQARERTSPI